jgi:hypothetical protein
VFDQLIKVGDVETPPDLLRAAAHVDVTKLARPNETIERFG